MINLENLDIKLTPEERDILQGKQGPTMQKVMETLVLYGEALGAERLVDIEGDGHFVIAWATPGIAPSLEMLDELVAAGLKTKHPFTLDPKAPLDFENLSLRPEQERLLEQMYRDQARYDERMLQLGLRDADAYTCNPYLPEVGNIPQRGTILAWSESACAIFANSVLGARTNRNGAIMDLLSNIVGKTPAVSTFYEVVAPVRIACFGQATIFGLKVAGVSSRPPEADEASQRCLAVVFGLGVQVAPLVTLEALHEAMRILNLSQDTRGVNQPQAVDGAHIGSAGGVSQSRFDEGVQLLQFAFQEANVGQKRVEDDVDRLDQTRGQGIGMGGGSLETAGVVGGIIEMMSADAIQFLGQVIEGHRSQFVDGGVFGQDVATGSTEDIGEGHGFAGVVAGFEVNGRHAGVDLLSSQGVSQVVAIAGQALERQVTFVEGDLVR